jgi:uncharacterized protein involved in exopolysaccharide biosynthesis
VGPRSSGEPLSVARPPPASVAADAADLSMKDVLSALFKRRAGMSVIALSVLLLVAAVTFALPRMYEAHASLLVKFGREHVVRPEVGQERPLVSMSSEEILNAEVLILTSDDMLRDVVAAVGLDRLFARRPLWADPPASVDAAVVALRDALTVDAVRRSSVLQVTFEHRDPVVARDFVNALVARYRDKRLEVLGGEKSEFADVQLGAYSEELKKQERRLEAFRQQHGVFVYAQQMEMLLQRRSDLEAQHRDAGVRLGEVRKGLASLRRELGRTTHAPEVRSQINRDIIRMAAEEESLQSRQASLAELLRGVAADVLKLDLNERELQAIQRDRAEAERNYQAFRTKAEEQRLANELDEMKVSNVSVIQGATVPTKHARPRTGVNLVLGAAFGILTALLYAILAEYLSQSMSTPHAVERRLGLPVLATVGRRRG